jgi:sugar phosphate isomerase/epimerase
MYRRGQIIADQKAEEKLHLNSTGIDMRVGLHSAPEGFSKSSSAYDRAELSRLVEKADRLGFRCFQIGPTSSFPEIDGECLRTVLDTYGMERNVHVGGLYDAERFVASEEELNKAREDLRRGIVLSKQISSSLVSFHPPFFKSEHWDKALSSRTKTGFLKLIKEEVSLANDMGIKMALESFCYPPFIFNGLDDFMQFVSNFPPTELGILLEVGHLYQAGFNLDKAIHTFGSRVLDVHVHDATRQKDFRKATHLPIGKGTIDFSRLIFRLRRVGYEGWLTLEIHGSDREIVESRELLEDLIK